MSKCKIHTSTLGKYGVARVRRASAIAALAIVLGSPATFATPSSDRIGGLLAGIPQGGWVMASTNKFYDAVATGSNAVGSNYNNAGAIIEAWSSFGWDSTRGDLLLWGGGHANYAGNEMYVWDGATGHWGRGSLASRLDAQNFVVDSLAPQSAHTYDNNLYLPVNDMFLTLGGASFQTGGGFETKDGNGVHPAGPWMWDPRKANPNLVGGSSGSGWDPVTAGGNMWINRQGQWTGTEAPSKVNGTSAIRIENGLDIVYMTADTNGSGFPSLYRYSLGDVRNGGLDQWEKIGTMWNSAAYGGAGTIAENHNFYIRTALGAQAADNDLAVWNLGHADATNPGNNKDFAVHLQLADGTPFLMTANFGVEYDPVNGKVLLWDGSNMGTVWYVDIATDSSGNPLPTWTVTAAPSSTGAQPSGSFMNGVWGKWHYAADLGAFVALNEFNRATGDAEVWFYKPYNVAAVPEPDVNSLLLAGLGVLAVAFRRQRSSAERQRAGLAFKPAIGTRS